MKTKKKKINGDFYPFNFNGEKTIDGNCVVIKCPSKTVSEYTYGGHMCGYAVYKKEEVPSDWHGNYDAPGLQLLNIHKGITYASIHCTDKEQEEAVKLLYEQKRYDLSVLLKANPKWEDYWDERRKLEKELLAKRKEIGYDYVIFGFDCAHSDDENNPLLKDVNHVMMLTKQMDAQLKKFATAYEYYKGSEEREEKFAILDQIREEGTTKTEIGLGGFLNALGNKI